MRSLVLLTFRVLECHVVLFWGQKEMWCSGTQNASDTGFMGRKDSAELQIWSSSHGLLDSALSQAQPSSSLFIVLIFNIYLGLEKWWKLSSTFQNTIYGSFGRFYSVLVCHKLYIYLLDTLHRPCGQTLVSPYLVYDDL